MKRAKPWLVAIASLAITTTAFTGTASAAPSGPAKPAQGKLLTTLSPETLPAAAPAPALGQTPIDREKHCAPTVPGSKERATGAVKECVQVAPATADARNSSTRSAPAAAVTCGAPPDYWSWSRHGYCFNDFRFTYTLYDADGTVTGTGEVSLTSKAELNATSRWWNQEFTATVTKLTGNVSSIVFDLEASCDNGCGMINKSPWPAKVLNLGQSVTGHVTFDTIVSSGQSTMVTPTFHYRMFQIGDTPGDFDFSFPFPQKVRCDAEVVSTPGCVISASPATLHLPISQYGAAAVTYWYAQTQLIDHWGASDSPLMRMASKAGAEANRARTCGSHSSDPFVPLPQYIPQDSCDEYPFAATYQGGSDGGQCAEIMPNLEDGQWVFYVPNGVPTGNEPCVRGHVSLPVNQAAGGKYGNFVQNERVLDTEKFKVSVTQ
ncbi:hypothetical protein GCM10010182_00320 [Actinomadura cremea]|nr:hypothetical protein GCM10010182_00320 [Actinomadura cremea]